VNEISTSASNDCYSSLNFEDFSGNEFTSIPISNENNIAIQNYDKAKRGAEEMSESENVKPKKQEKLVKRSISLNYNEPNMTFIPIFNPKKHKGGTLELGLKSPR